MNSRKAMAGRWGGLLAFMCSWTLAAANAPLFTVEEQQWIKRHPVVYFAANEQRPPLSYVRNGVYKGLVAEYIAVISRKSGLHFRRHFAQTRADIVKLFLAGEINVLPLADPARTPPELSGRLVYTEPYFTSPRLVITRADEPVMLSNSELDGKVVSLFDTAATRQLMLAQFPEAKPLFMPNAEQALDAVAAHRAYASIGAEVILGPLLRSKYSGLLSISGSISNAPLSLRMAVRKDEPLLFSIIEKSLQSLSVQDTDILQEQAMEQVDDGAPTIMAWLRYNAWEMVWFALGIALLALFAWRAWAARQAAMRSEKMKSHLLAVIGHEIPASIHDILGSLETLQRTPLSDHQQRFTRTASAAAEAVLQLLGNVLDLCRLDAHRLPSARLPTDTAASVENAGGDTPVAARARILVVEDHPQSRLILLEQLKTLGVDPVGLPDGAAALAEIARQAPALILMDCHMPGMDGYETTRRIRQREAKERLPHVPVIAISTASDAQHQKMCIDSGMDGILKKPLRTQDLQSLLQAWLEQAPHNADEPADAHAEPSDIRALYQASMAEDVHAAEQAVKRRHRDEVAHFAHRIKGAALMLGAQPMADAADRLEQTARNATAAEPAPMEAELQLLKNAIARYFEPFDGAG